MITTVTCNPALDRLLSVPSLQWGEANRVQRLCDAAAGKGIDVAKVLRDLDCPVTATGFLGGEVAHIFTHFFQQESIRDACVPIRESTRTNIQIFEESGRRTELLENGPRVDSREREALLERVAALAEESDVTAVCGSMPGGVDEAYFRQLIRAARGGCPLVVVDASGRWLRAALEEKPDLIKPNRSEMRELMGQPQADESDIAAYARQLVRQGIAHVLVSLGADGALLACEAGVWRGSAPDVPVKSTLGCGDTMVASLCLSLRDGVPPDEMLRRALALSSANAMTFETAHIDPAQYRRLLPRCGVRRLI